MIVDQLKVQLKEAMIARDSVRVSVIRFLNAAITNKEIELRSQGIELIDKHVVKVIEKQIKQRKDSIENYKSGNRQDLVDKENAELVILEELLSKYSSEAVIDAR